nr:hypothetical protein [Candidatus Freyarchaeota archaeon]
MGVENANRIPTSSSENEFTSSGEWDNKNAVFFAKMAIEETAKLYGSIFTRMASKYALEFEVEKLKEKPPENIQGLEEVINYITANLDRYPRGHCALVYGIGKADYKLQGSSAAGSKRAAYGASKSIIGNSGILNSVVGTTEDVFEACKKWIAAVQSTKVMIPTRFIRGENNQVNIVFHACCMHKDACMALLEEGISRMIGGLECIILILINAGVEIITKKHFDYTLEEFDKPDCRGRIFEV